MPAWAPAIYDDMTCAHRSSRACCTSTGRADVDAFVLMPNHVHAIIVPRDDYNLSTLLKGIKGVSANRCNNLLRSKASFWMDESYDHIVRDAKELAAFRDYIAENPNKARLKSHEYSFELRNVLVA